MSTSVKLARLIRKSCRFLTSVHFFKDEVKTVWLFEVLNQLVETLKTFFHRQ
jgi:hypothetical protein